VAADLTGVAPEEAGAALPKAPAIGGFAAAQTADLGSIPGAR